MPSSILDQYGLPAVLTVTGLHQMLRMSKAVGNARHKFDVKVPETTGPPEFIRTFRAHQNSVEFLPSSLAALWLGSVFVHPVPASLLYGGYLIGREKFFHGYVEDAEKRLPGFKLSAYSLVALLALCFLGAEHKCIRHFTGVDLWEIICDHCPFGKN